MFEFLDCPDALEPVDAFADPKRNATGVPLLKFGASTIQRSSEQVAKQQAVAAQRQKYKDHVKAERQKYLDREEKKRLEREKAVREALQRAQELERQRIAAEQVVHYGPLGGKYRIVRGRKRYDVG